MLALFRRSLRADGPVRIVRKDHLRRKLGLTGGVEQPLADLLAANAASDTVPWLAGLSSGDLEAARTVVRPAAPNEQFDAPPSRVFEGRRINLQYWGQRRRHALVLSEFRDVLIASDGNDLSIFRGTTIDDRSVGIVARIRDVDPDKVARLGTVALCDDQFMPGNPCHVLVDRMTRAVMFRELGVEESDISFVFGTSKFGPYARDKVVPRARGLDAGRVYRVDRLLVLSTTFQPQPGHPYWYGDRAIMDAILTPLFADIAPRRVRKLYLSRTDATRRPLVNERELIARLEAAGFETVVMGALSPHAQLSLCREAQTIVAPHGAALMNAVAAEPGTRVVEMFNPEIGSGVYAIVSHLRGHDYVPLFGEPVRAEGVSQDGWRIDVDAVLAATR